MTHFLKINSKDTLLLVLTIEFFLHINYKAVLKKYTVSLKRKLKIISISLKAQDPQNSNITDYGSKSCNVPRDLELRTRLSVSWVTFDPLCAKLTLCPPENDTRCRGKGGRRKKSRVPRIYWIPRRKLR